MRTNNRVLLWSLALGLFAVPPAFSAPFREQLPQLVRLTGTFSTAAANTGEHPYLLEVSIEGKPRSFSVAEVKSLTNDEWGPQILRNSGALLVLTGPEELLDCLRNAEAEQASVQLEGRLYIEGRTLALSSVVVE
jgi:hypothetical protein